MARESEFTRSREILAAIESILASGELAVLVTVISGQSSLGAKLLIREDGAAVGTLAHPAMDTAAIAFTPVFLASRQEAKPFMAVDLSTALNLDPGSRLLFERIAPEPRLIVCGAGHVGAALARLGPAMGFRTSLIDDRGELLRPELFPDLELALLRIADWSVGVRDAIGSGRGAYVAIVTRGHREDEDCLRSVLLAEPDYVGMIGSRRRTNIVLDRLRATGASAELLNEVRAPIGLDLGAVTPEEVALAIMAEIVAQRRGGSGLSLSAWRRADR